MQATRGTSLTPDLQPAAGPRRRVWLLFAGVAVVAYLADLGTKLWAVRALAGREPIHLVGSLLQLDLTRNPGAAFSTGTSYTAVLTVLAATAAVVVLVLSRRLGDRLWAVGLGLLLAGVCGNLTDRVFREPGAFRGHVVDFLELPHWPVFNVADMLIDAAVVVIMVQAWRGVRLSGERARETTT